MQLSHGPLMRNCADSAIVVIEPLLGSLQPNPALQLTRTGGPRSCLHQRVIAPVFAAQLRR